MRGLYITSQDMSDVNSGVNKKIRMQIEALGNLGMEVEIPDLAFKKQIDKLIRRLPFVKCEFEKKLYELIKNRECMNNIDFAYIRHPMVSMQLLHLIKRLKDSGIYIVYEFPTFPYDKNSNKLSAKVSLVKDKLSRNKLCRYVDVGVNYSGYHDIFSIPCITISNGIDINSIKSHQKTKQCNIINFIGVALLAKWNGYDRLIRAIGKYNNENHQNKVQFHIVGNGDIFDELKKQVNDKGVNDSVFLHGFMSGKELDDLYNQCDIGVGTLNPSRKYKNHIMSSLKTKEYTAKGVPFIKGDIDEVFDKNNLDFIFNVSDDESPIDLDEIIVWYETLIKTYGHDELVKKMREFASEELSWEKQLSPVVENIRENCK